MIDWESAVEIISEGSVTAAVQRGESNKYATWGVADSQKIAYINGRKLTGKFNGEDSMSRARKACEDAFYAYLDVKATESRAI